MLLLPKYAPTISEFTVLILLYLFLFTAGLTVAIYLVFFLRTATRYLELRIWEIEDKPTP